MDEPKEIDVFRSLRCAFFLCMTLWGEAAWASGSGTACRHFEQCPTLYTVLLFLLGPYLLWLAWDTFSSFCKNRDYLRNQKKAKQRKPRKSTKKQAANQKESPTPMSGDHHRAG
jgi:threonine/homoserine/homoserine lactone efflux protein